MIIFFQILNESISKKDPLLVFSQWLGALDLIETLLQKETINGKKWEKSKNYFRLDGQTNARKREQMINKFNESKGENKIWMFLISTKAGGVGINLIGANRIVIMDSCWNPCYEAQASCRIYRFGQKKNTYIYRLVKDNTIEKDVFNRQLYKLGIFKEVVDHQRVDLNLYKEDIHTILRMLLEKLENISEPPDQLMDQQIDDQILHSVYNTNKQCLTSMPQILNELFEQIND